MRLPQKNEYRFMTTWAILEKEEQDLHRLNLIQKLIIQGHNDGFYDAKINGLEIECKTWEIQKLKRKIERPNHINEEIQRCKTVIASCSQVSNNNMFYDFSQQSIKLYNELIEEYEGYLGPPVMK